MESDLSAFVARVAERMAPLEKTANSAYWRFAATSNPEDEKEFSRRQIELKKIFSSREELAELQNLRAKTPAGDDLLLDRQAELLELAFRGQQMDEATIADLTEREVEVERMFNSFRARLRGREVTDNDIKEILRNSADHDLRREAWEASKQIGVAVAPKLRELARRRNRAAREMGYDDYYRMRLQLQEIDGQELFDAFDTLDKLIAGPYRDFKRELDAALAARWDFAAEQARPWHYADPFFQDPPFADEEVNRYMEETFRDKNLEEITRATFTAIGLDISRVQGDLYERPGKDQHAFCVDIDRSGDVRVLCNIKPNARWMETMLHEHGHAAYDLYIDPGLPYLLREPAHILTTEGIAMMMGDLVHNPAWLLRHAHAEERITMELAPRIRAWGRTNNLIMARWVPVMSAFEREFYREPDQDLQQLWWETVERLQMVAMPAGREAACDWATKIHLGTAPVYYHNYLLGYMVSSQLRHTILTGILDGGDKAERYVTSPEVGAYLAEKVFKPGTRRHWQEFLLHATGERLNPQYYVDYAIQS